MLSTPIQVDGSFGEGGGALCRTAVLMAAFTQQPLRLTGVRGGTKFPGITAEDLVLIEACARITEAEVRGAEIGSNDLGFAPVRRCRSFQGVLTPSERNSACCGAVIMGSLIPLLARAGAYSSLSITGETYGLGILTYDYFQQITLEAFRRTGLYATTDLISAGFGRGAQGQIACEIEPSALHGIQWPTRGRMLSLVAIVTTANLPKTVSDRGAAHLKKLAQSAGVALQIETLDVPSTETGAFITIASHFESGLGGTTAMGQKGLRIEAVAQSAFDGAMHWLANSATVDAFLADQILLPCILAESDSYFSVPRITSRLLTMAWVIRQFLPIHITIHGDEGKPGTVTVRRG